MEDLKNLYRVSRKGCWVFNGYIGTGGYGQLTRNGKVQKAHRYFYEMLVGKIPTGLTIDHLCRNRPCVNPKHLEPVTFKENVLRGISFSAVNARKTHCNNGHKFTQENTLINSCENFRVCRTCQNKVNRECYHRRKHLRKPNYDHLKEGMK